MTKDKTYLMTIEWQSTEDWIKECGSHERAYRILKEELGSEFHLTRFFQFVNVAIFLNRLDEIEEVVAVSEEETSKRFNQLISLYADPEQESLQNRLMEHYDYRSTLYIYIICMKALNRWDEFFDAAKRYEEKIGGEQGNWMHYQRGIVFQMMGEKEKAKEAYRAAIAGNRGNMNLHLRAFDMEVISSERLFQVAYRCNSRLARRQFNRFLLAERDTYSRNLDWKRAFHDPLLCDATPMDTDAEVLIDLLPHYENWISLFWDWKRGDYKVYETRLNHILETESEGDSESVRYAKWIAYWRLLWVQNKYSVLLASIEDVEEGFSEEVIYIEMLALKTLAVGKARGGDAARIALRTLWHHALVHHASRFGELDFDSIIMIECVLMAGEEILVSEVLEKAERNQWNSWWIKGRIAESKFEFLEAKKAYEITMEKLENRHPAFFLFGDAYERLALIHFDLGLIQEGNEYRRKFEKYCNQFFPENEPFLQKQCYLQAKASFAEGRYREAIHIYEEVLSSARLTGSVLFGEYQRINADYIQTLLVTGAFRKMKEEVERLPERSMTERLNKARFLYEWANVLGDREERNRSWLVIQDAMQNPDRLSFQVQKRLEVLALLEEEKHETLSFEKQKQLREWITKPGKMTIEYQAIFLWFRSCEKLGIKPTKEEFERIEWEIAALGRPPMLEAEWLQVKAIYADEAECLLRERFEIMRNHFGMRQIQTMHALLDLLPYEPFDWKESLLELIDAAQDALAERVSSLPLERQMDFGRELSSVYERVLLFCLDRQDEEIMALLVPWSYQIKGFPMRIQHFAFRKMRQKGRKRDFLRFSDLSLKILDNPMQTEGERENQKAWKKERDELAKSLSIYRDFAIEVSRSFTSPDLPKGKIYVEMVETEQSVFLFQKNDTGWHYFFFGKKRDWERRMRLFRRDLMRDKADFDVFADKLFTGFDRNTAIRLAPDGMFFSLPFTELFATAGFQDYEVWPNLIFYREGDRKFDAASGVVLFGRNYLDRPDLKFVAFEVYSLLAHGFQAISLIRGKERYLGNYRGFFHFSGHGENRAARKGFARNPFVESRLLLPNGDAITALDISILNWSRCPLVFLNACESGSGSFISSQGVLGLSYGLFLGYARTMITTLYPVNDELAAKFSETFYDALLQVEDVLSAFLLAKQVWTDRGASERDLAAFQLIGSGDKLIEPRVSKWKRLLRIQKKKLSFRGTEGAKIFPGIGLLLAKGFKRKKANWDLNRQEKKTRIRLKKNWLNKK